jgi:hypothetical protein
MEINSIKKCGQVEPQEELGKQIAQKQKNPLPKGPATTEIVGKK